MAMVSRASAPQGRRGWTKLTGEPGHRFRPVPVAQVLTVVAGALGVVVLIGSANGNPSLSSVPVGAVPMTANAAFCLVVASLSLLVLMGTAHASLARAGGLSVAIVGGLTLLEYAMDRSFGIDHVIFGSRLGGAVSSSGRMAPLSAASYLIVGTALMAGSLRWRAAVQACAAAVFVVGFTALIGYVYDAGALYRLGPYSSMALPTAAALVLLSVALVLSDAEYGFVEIICRGDAGGVLLRRLLPVALVGPVAVGWLEVGARRVAHLDSHVGLAIVVTGCHAILCLVIWRAANATSQLDRQCRQALDDLAEANDRLEGRVEHDTALLATTSTELETLFASAPIGLVKLDVDGRCVSVNPRWCELSGLSEIQSGGLGWWQAFHPEDRAAVAAECSHIVADSHDVSFTYRLLTPGGATCWVQGSAAVLHDGAGAVIGYLAVVTDITAYQEAQRKLVDAHARIGTAFSSSPIGKALVSLDGQFIDVNQALCRLVGRSADELIGLDERALWHPEDEGGDPDALNDVLTGSAPSYELEHRIVRPDAAGCWVTETIAPVIIDGRPAYLVAEYVDITARRLAEQRLTHQALHDPLTGLPNRLLFMDRLEHALARGRRNGSALAVLFVDLDHFKVINDSLGHDAGDQLLRIVANRLMSTVRSTDTIARLGGDEFVLLAEDVSADVTAAELAVRLTDVLQAPIRIGAELVTVHASIGIAMTMGGTDSPAGILHNADTAMYRAKERGRARYELFNDDLRVQAMHRVSVITGLRHAMDEDGPDAIVGVYQPVIDLQTGRVAGAEALARWFDGREMVQPLDFIPIAEESGLILQLGEVILLEACTKAAGWRRDGLDLDIAVNVSARQVVRPDFVDVVQRSLAGAGLQHKHLVLELTESVLLDVIGSASHGIQQLRELGVRFAIDDFGTGFSSLAYLHDLTVDQLKIDRRFTAGLGVHPQDEAIVASIVTLSQQLGLDLIAEGVETEAQADHLRKLGCRRAQGYLFSRPVDDLDLARQATPSALSR